MPRANKIRSLDDIVRTVKQQKHRPTLVLASAAQEEGLKCLAEAVRCGIVNPILIGDKRKVTQLVRKLRLSLLGMEIIDEPDPHQAAHKAVSLCREHRADILMKGAVTTDSILRSVLDRETGLSMGKLLSHVSVFTSPIRKSLMFMSDPAININPDVSRKVDIIKNALSVARRLGVKNPKVALLAASEKINIKDMPATTDAVIIAKMYESGQLTGAEVAGPYGLDIAISEFAARCKNISGPVAGHADILICPDINSANIFYKTLVYFCGIEMAGVVIGAKVPIVMTSRSDSSLTKFYTVALCVMLAGAEAK
jgi:phosphate butyryltransferase